MSPEIEARLKEMKDERDRKVAALDPEKAASAHVFLDTIMAMTSPDDMIGVLFCIRSAVIHGATKGELMTIISDLSTAHEAERLDAEKAR